MKSFEDVFSEKLEEEINKHRDNLEESCKTFDEYQKEAGTIRGLRLAFRLFNDLVQIEKEKDSD